MSLSMRHVAVALLAVAPLLSARPTAPSKDGPTGPPRLDAHGDPLPPGAAARIGTVRFRHGGHITRIEFSPDGRTIYTACPSDKVVRAWSVADGREVRRFGGDRPLSTFGLSPDGTRLITGENGHLIRVWSASDGRELHRLTAALAGMDSDGRPGQTWVSFARFGPDGKTVLAQYLGNTFIVWNAVNGQQMRTWTDEGSNRPAAISRDGRRLALSGPHGVRVVDAATGVKVGTVSLSENREIQLAALAVSPDGSTVATSGVDPIVRLWNVATSEEFRQHRFPAQAYALAFSPDGSALAIAHGDGEDGTAISVVDVATAKTRRLEGTPLGVFSPTFSPDGKLLAFGDAGHTVRLWDVATGKEVRSAAGHAGALTTIAVSPDARLVATCSNQDTAVRLWDPATGAEVRRLDGHSTGVDEVTFSPDGRLLVSAAWNQPVLIWEAATGKLLRRLADHPALGAYLWFADDGKTLATGGQAGSIALWDCITGKLIRQLAAPPNGLAALLSFRDGRLLAYENPERDDDNEQQSIGLWDVTANRLVRRFRGHRGRVNGVTLSADGRLLASRGTDKSIRVWEVATGAERLTLKEPGGVSQTGSWTGTQFLAFSPDGRVLVTAATDDPFARRWDLATGKELPPLTGHLGWVGAVDFAADGRVLVTGSQDTTALVWNAESVLPRPAAPVRRTETEFAALWEDLRSRDAAKSHAAIWALVGSGDRAVDFVGRQTSPAAPVDEDQITRWIVDLGRDNFLVRERATAALNEVVDQAEAALRATLERTRSAEVRQRIGRILDAATSSVPTPERLREMRAVEVLESITTPAARRLLTHLAGGAAGAGLTRDARGAITRFDRRIR